MEPFAAVRMNTAVFSFVHPCRPATPLEAMPLFVDRPGVDGQDHRVAGQIDFVTALFKSVRLTRIQKLLSFRLAVGISKRQTKVDNWIFVIYIRPSHNLFNSPSLHMQQRETKLIPGDTAMPKNLSTSVVIIGGGPVGLAMGLLLHRSQIDCVVLEKTSGTTDNPKSRGCWVRTMELFRQWGIEEKVRARGLPEGSDFFVFVENMSGYEYGRTRPEPRLDQSSTWKCLVAQDVVEEELYAALQESPYATVVHSSECIGVEQDADGVVAQVRSSDGGEPWTINAKYAIAADGAGSQIRRQAGIEMKGPATLAVMANDYWRADLSRLPMARDAAGFRIFPKNPDIPNSTILNTNGRDRWLSVSQIGEQKDDRAEPWSDEVVVKNARAHTGIADLDVQIIHRSIWRVSRQVAQTFRQGRVFLAGDAAHRFPPTGGFGLNSGVQDAHNLAWKLAFVLRGQASEKLLDSYTPERLPIAESNADFSMGNRHRFEFIEHACRSEDEDRIRFWVNDMDNHMHSIGQSLGFIYKSNAVLEDGTVAKGLNSRYYVPSDRPGARFPHVWLDPARKHSTLDWFDREFVVVTGPLGDKWAEAAKTVQSRLGLPLMARKLPAVETDTGIQIGLRGAVLVRPDGHVAWRMPYLPDDPAKALTTALMGILQ